MICIYHSRDLDGYSSGAIIKQKYPEAKLIGFDYGQKLPMEQIPSGEEIIMVDVSLPMKEMDELAKHSGCLTWIDHHKSAIADFHAYFVSSMDRKEVELSYGGGGLIVEYSEPHYKIITYLQNGTAACEITWQCCFGDIRMPDAIKFLGQYDTWRKAEVGNRWDTEILTFQFGMRLICNSPETFPVILLDTDHDKNEEFITTIMNNGHTVLQYQAQVNTTQCKGCFEYTFEGFRAICLNGGGFNSDVFKTVYDESKHDIMMPFKYDGKAGKWIVSIYSTKDELDCSVIAKTKGGGGHKSAAGFQVNDIKTIFNNI